MKVNKYSHEMQEFLINNYKQCKLIELVRQFNAKFNQSRTMYGIKSFLQKRGCTKNFQYSFEMVEYIKENYNHNIFEMVEKFNRQFKVSISKVQMQNMIARIGITREKIYTEARLEFIRNIATNCPSYQALANEFNNKFNISQNSESLRGICRKYNIKIAGARTKRNIGDYVTYNGVEVIKIGKNKHVRKSTYLYEKKYGKIGKNEKIIFADGNLTNYDYDNLLKVDVGDFMQLVKIGLYGIDKETTLIGLNIVKINRKIKELKNKSN